MHLVTSRLRLGSVILTRNHDVSLPLMPCLPTASSDTCSRRTFCDHDIHSAALVEMPVPLKEAAADRTRMVQAWYSCLFLRSSQCS